MAEGASLFPRQCSLHCGRTTADVASFIRSRWARVLSGRANEAMRRIGFVELFALQLIASAALANGPQSTPRQYVTHNYGLTFLSPAGSSYCPLPQNWVGSDHGTTVFLEPPTDCGGAGYPSSARRFLPASAPRIEVYYGYWPGEDEPKALHCKIDGWVNLLASRRAICHGVRDGMLTEEITAKYGAHAESQVIITLVTTVARRERDLAVLESLAASMRSCATEPVDVCPPGNWF